MPATPETARMPRYAAAVTLTTLTLGSLVAGNRIVSAEHEPTAIVEAGALHTAGAGKAALTGCEVVPEFLPLEQCYPEPKNPLEHLTPTSSTTSTTTTTRPRPTTTVAPRVVQQRASRSAAPRSVMPPAQATAPSAPVNGNKVDWMNAAGIAKENQGYVDGIMTPRLKITGWSSLKPPSISDRVYSCQSRCTQPPAGSHIPCAILSPNTNILIAVLL